MEPEKVCMSLMRILREQILDPHQYEEIISAGSIPLGTYIYEPDIDIFIKSKRPRGVYRALSIAFPHGRKKKGELDIWYLPDYCGYEVDFVVITPDDDRIQTLNHVKYYMEVLTPEMKEEVKNLKRFLKKANVYGGVEGVTGICATRLVELHGNVEEVLRQMLLGLTVRWDKYMVEDPTLEGRNLIASMTHNKRRNFIAFCSKYGIKLDEIPLVNPAYMTGKYDTMIRVRRKKSMGTDREIQFVNKCISDSYKVLKQRIKHWKPQIEYDTIVYPKDIYIGYTVTPKELIGPVKVIIPRDRLNEKAIYNLMTKYKCDHTLDTLTYYKPPPFKDVWMEYTKNLFERLQKVYIEVEKI